jgi:DNA-directed RNA polymerase subunit alpha
MDKARFARRLDEIEAATQGILERLSVLRNELAEPDILDKDIEVLGLSLRVENALRARDERVDTVGRLIALSEVDVLKSPALGKKSLEEIKAMLAEHGLALAPKE